uniref:non-specific serine/threonine protein kinase n=1 Tax=Salix viminalis TaxID=40686 RepID=A0A6N2KY45_SALVM
MFSTMERDPNYTLWNTQNVAVHADFNRILVDTIGTAVYQAANMPAGVKKFAATKANYTTQDMLYVLVQCTPDLSSNDCHQCLLAAYSGLEICCNKKRGGRILFPSCIDSPLIRLDIVLKATNQFSNENKLGQGGFGPVYKGVMEDGKEIAVKRLSRTSGQGLREFMNEVNLIARLQHRNLVKLLGCCLEKNEKLLVYEYMPNKSLDVFLYDSTMRVQLDWQTRLSIINGIARGLMYLHVDSRLRIIHRDLKASNILLDYEMNPKISDFGMARIFGGNLSEANTNRIILLIYLAPMTKLNSKDAVRHGEGGFIVSGNCNMRFDLYKYYNASSYLLTYPSHKGSNWKIGMVALAVCAPVVVIVIVIGSCIVCLLKKRGQQRGVERSHQAFLKELACPRGVTMTDEGQLVSSEDLPFMDLTTISAATENFSENNKLGEGGFGAVYKDSRLRIIHRDLKPSNVLLDHEMVAKISDFGMARIFEVNQNKANTRRVVGTFGYMAPEYAMEGLFSVKSDVFSFGVILLEIISGKRSSGFYLTEHGQTLLAYAWRLWNEGREMELAILGDGKEVAVKRLSASSQQGKTEFTNEVLLIMKLQHKNLVKLLGFCVDGEEKLLIYEFMPNNSLDVILFDPRKRAQLSWRSRINIIDGIAKGTLYLHEDSRLRIIHRDLKASNILLDNNMNPKISDFGMARIMEANEGEANTARIGVLPDGKEIAVKRLSRKSWQGLEEFKNEVKVIAKLQHRNLVRLLGCGIEGEEKLLIYEFMHYKSLDLLIFDAESRRAQLDWETCYSIAGGIARGLLYLHEDSRLRIIHRDLKPSNVLLDHEMVAKISDFGMARIFEENQNKANTRRVAWRLWNEGREVELVDPSLMERGQTEGIVRCIHVGLLCVQKDPADRPTMSFVVLALGSDPITLPQPKEPAFSLCKMFPVHKSSTTDPSVNQMTVSGILPRHALLAMCFLIVLLSTIFATVVADPLYTACSTEYGNYDLGSPFEKNLKVVVETLPSISSSTGFNNTASGIFPDNVSGQALCRGDVTSSACQTCLREASQKLLERMQK